MTKHTSNDFGAYVEGDFCDVPPLARGTLDGLTFAVKDLIDVAGYPTGGGNPDWAATHSVPKTHSTVVETLLRAGAHVKGKTRTDDLSLGILGENAHYGMPVNPAAPERMPGGSSSGSAVAVASGEVDFALGTDTGGSVRVPSSFCGLYGIRPTHGRVSFAGVIEQSRDFDTLGWFARDGGTLLAVGEAILGRSSETAASFRCGADAFRFADDAVTDALRPALDRLEQVLPRGDDVEIAPQGLSVWQRSQRILQSSQAARNLLPWLEETNPRLAFGVARSILRGLAYTDEERGRAALMQREAKQRMLHLLAGQAVLAIPTTPFPAPLRGIRVSGLALDRISCLTSIAGLSGLPQVNLPWADKDGIPFGLSIVGAPGSDLTLARVAKAFGEIDA